MKTVAKYTLPLLIGVLIGTALGGYLVARQTVPDKRELPVTLNEIKGLELDQGLISNFRLEYRWNEFREKYSPVRLRFFPGQTPIGIQFDGRRYYIRYNFKQHVWEVSRKESVESDETIFKFLPE